jgi:hypothetical protein
MSKHKHDEHKSNHKHENHNSKKEWEAKIIAHAWKDPQFKKRLLSDPKAALKELHCPCSDKQQIKVIEEQENQWILVLPKAPAEANNLSEAELSALAGAGPLIPVETSQPGCYEH